MLFAIVINGESQSVQFIKCTKEQAIEAFEAKLDIAEHEGYGFGYYTAMLVDEDELTQANLVMRRLDGLEFDSTVCFVRYVDPSMALNETDYTIHA